MEYKFIFLNVIRVLIFLTYITGLSISAGLKPLAVRKLVVFHADRRSLEFSKTNDAKVCAINLGSEKLTYGPSNNTDLTLHRRKRSFEITDVQVPTAFLRIEYMISFCFLGLIYGLGFLVVFQSLCVPVLKIVVTLLYKFLAGNKIIDPITIQEALEKLPPT